MADEKTTFKLDLDADDFLSALDNAQSKMGLFGSADNLKGLVGAFDSLLPMLGVLGTAFAALKGSFEAVFEAEKIKSVNAQFDVLTENAGISTDTLREGLVKASGGLINTTDLLQVANKAIVSMGGSAERLPEILELARKAAVVTGGDTKAAFEGITQAVATGNLRMLKHMGIVIDTKKAYKEFADENGVAVDTLSQAGQKQALLNAVLEQGNERLKGIDTSVLATTNAFAQMQVIFTDIKETFLLVFDKTIAPYLTTFLQFVSTNLKAFKDTFQITFGDSKQKAEGLTESISTLKNELTRLQSGDLSWFERLSPKTVQDRIAKTTASIAAQEAQLKKLHQEQEARKPAGGKSESSKRTEDEITDQGKVRAAATQFEKDMVAIRKDRTVAFSKIAQTEAETNKIYSDQRINLEQEMNAKIAAIDNNAKLTDDQKETEKVELHRTLALQMIAADNERAQKMSEFRQKRQEELLAMATTEKQVEQVINNERDIAREQAFQKIHLIQESEILDEDQKAQQIEFINAQLQQNIVNINNRAYEARKSALDNEVKSANTAQQQILLGFHNASRKAAIEATNFTKVGENAFNKFGDNAVSAFEAVGKGEETLGQAMLQSFLGTIGQMAVERGKFILLSSIWPPDPLGLAAGAALIAFGGALEAAGGTSSTSVGGADVGTSAQATATTAPTAQNPPQASQVPQKSVTVQIMGHYFNTQQTATMLTDIIRQATDATNFTVQQVGGGF